MKKILAAFLTLTMVLSLGFVTVFAFSLEGEVSGDLEFNEYYGAIMGDLNGEACSFNVNADYTGTVAGGTISFSGPLCGSFLGGIAGKINYIGHHTLFATIDETTGSDYYLISSDIGPVDGDGKFHVVAEVIEIAEPGDVIPSVTSISLNPITDYGGHPDGSVYMQLGATVTPSDYTGPVFWSVWVDPGDSPKASVTITETGLLTVNDIGSGFTVIANTLDPTLKTQEFTFGADYKTVYGLTFSDGTDVEAEAGITFTVLIPASVNFGTVYRDTGVKTETFAVTVENALIEEGARIIVQNETADMNMYCGTQSLAFSLSQPGGTFTFRASDLTDGVDTITSAVTCDTASLDYAGIYKGYMTFAVDYVPLL